MATHAIAFTEVTFLIHIWYCFSPTPLWRATLHFQSTRRTLPSLVMRCWSVATQPFLIFLFTLQHVSPFPALQTIAFKLSLCISLTRECKRNHDWGSAVQWLSQEPIRTWLLARVGYVHRLRMGTDTVWVTDFHWCHRSLLRQKLRRIVYASGDTSSTRMRTSDKRHEGTQPHHHAKQKEVRGRVG